MFILAGYLLKRFGVFGKKDYAVLSKVVLNLTLPAAVITNFAAMEWSAQLLLIPVLAFLLNWLMMGVGLLTAAGGAHPGAVSAAELPGLQHRRLCTAVCAELFGPQAVVGACLFDVGNAVMCTGGSYAFTQRLAAGRRQRLSVKDAARRLFSSVPFDTYLRHAGAGGGGVAIPQGAVDFISPIAAANPFVAMLMVGMMFEVDLKPGYLRQMGLVLGLRLNGGAAGCGDVSASALQPAYPAGAGSDGVRPGFGHCAGLTVKSGRRRAGRLPEQPDHPGGDSGDAVHDFGAGSGLTE